MVRALQFLSSHTSSLPDSPSVGQGPCAEGDTVKETSVSSLLLPLPLFTPADSEPGSLLLGWPGSASSGFHFPRVRCNVSSAVGCDLIPIPFISTGLFTLLFFAIVLIGSLDKEQVNLYAFVCHSVPDTSILMQNLQGTLLLCLVPEEALKTHPPQMEEY